MKYFIIWKDYDHDEIEEFDEEQIFELERRLTELTRKIDREEYGGNIKAVIYGEKVEYEVVSRVEEIKIKEK